ncbi:MAG: TIGR00730 family Rossman fold protein [Rhodospirillales bacterium]|nr:TIGR00730 family Rossman fold protein [Rhodospirillales bacterium]
MASIRSVAVFCGSAFGKNPAYAEAAAALGRGLARAGIRVIYGGGHNGLMGVVADAALDAGGEVIGVIPHFLIGTENGHDRLTRLEVTEDMHSRKRRMFDLSEGFVALPGGIGTLDETIEMISWRQLGRHDRPILLCDVAGSIAPLAAALAAMAAQGFIRPTETPLYEYLDGPAAVLARLTGA